MPGSASPSQSAKGSGKQPEKGKSKDPEAVSELDRLMRERMDLDMRIQASRAAMGLTDDAPPEPLKGKGKSSGPYQRPWSWHFSKGYAPGKGKGPKGGKGVCFNCGGNHYSTDPSCPKGAGKKGHPKGGRGF
jgi:hypothetical protein